MASFVLPEPAPLAQQSGAGFAKLVELMQRLLAPNGCPWDREQTPESLCRYVVEESSELLDAIDSGDPNQVRDELGDLALQVAFLAELYRERDAFGPDDVMRGICEKLVRRHPHVFGTETAASAADVEVHWERIKHQEKQQRPLLDKVPRHLPALLRAEQTGHQVARVGFDWPDAASSREKVDEELAELTEAIASGDRNHVEEEFGDLLFALCNWGRHLGVEPELCLRRACDKFRARFDQVEAQVQERHGDWPRDAKGKPTTGIGLAELDEYWNVAKRSST